MQKTRSKVRKKVVLLFGTLVAVVLMGIAPAVAWAYPAGDSGQTGLQECIDCASGGKATGGNGGNIKSGPVIGGDGANGGKAYSLSTTNGGDAKANGGTVSERMEQLQSAVFKPGASVVDRIIRKRRAHKIIYTQYATQNCVNCANGGTATGGNGGNANTGPANGGDGGTGAVGGAGGAGSGDGKDGTNGTGNTGGNGGLAASFAQSDGGKANALGGSVSQAINQTQRAIKRIPRWAKRVVFRQYAIQRCILCSAGGTATGGNGGNAATGNATGGDGGAAGGANGAGTGGQAASRAKVDGAGAGADGGYVSQAINQAQWTFRKRVPRWVKSIRSVQHALQECVLCSVGGTATGGNGGNAATGNATGGDGGAAGGASGTGTGGQADTRAKADGGSADADGGSVSQSINQTQSTIAERIPRSTKVSYEQHATQRCVLCSAGGNATGGDGGNAAAGNATGGAGSGAGGRESTSANATGGNAGANGGSVSQSVNQARPSFADPQKQSTVQDCAGCAAGGVATGGDDGTSFKGNVVTGNADPNAAGLAGAARIAADLTDTTGVTDAGLAAVHEAQSNAAGLVEDVRNNAAGFAEDARSNAAGLPAARGTDLPPAHDAGKADGTGANLPDPSGATNAGLTEDARRNAADLAEDAYSNAAGLAEDAHNNAAGLPNDGKNADADKPDDSRIGGSPDRGADVNDAAGLADGARKNATGQPDNHAADPTHDSGADRPDDGGVGKSDNNGDSSERPREQRQGRRRRRGRGYRAPAPEAGTGA